MNLLNLERVECVEEEKCALCRERLLGRVCLYDPSDDSYYCDEQCAEEFVEMVSDFGLQNPPK